MALSNTSSSRPQSPVQGASANAARPAPKALAVSTPSTLADISWWITGALAVVMVMLAMAVATLIRAATGDLTMAWFISRGAGIASYVLITSSMIYGLMITTKTASGTLPAPVTFSMHEFLSWLGLVLGIAHAVVLMWDGYIHYTPANILVPFNSDYRPLWVGIGQISFYISAIVLASFYAKKLIGHKVWRFIHYVSFITFLMVTLHGVQSGTDSTTPAMQIVYIASLSVVLFLTCMRILTAKGPKAAKAAPVSRVNARNNKAPAAAAPALSAHSSGHTPAAIKHTSSVSKPVPTVLPQSKESGEVDYFDI